MFKRLTFTLIVVVLSVVFSSKPVFAQVRVTVPSFPACTKPQGAIKVSYSSGTHGIVGDLKTYTGKDVVYTLSEDTLMQCFCSEDEDQGIQTNWWKVSSLSFDEVDYLKQLGWVYIPTGSVWGLDDSPYMAINKDYSCKSDDDDDDKDKDEDDDDDDEGGRGSVLGSSVAEVLGLATTGNYMEIFASVLAGLSLILSSVYVYKNRK